MDHRQAMDRHFKWNVIGISGAEFLWGLGLPVVFESTFLQLFISIMGASSFQIGLVPAFYFVGSSVFSLIAGYYTSRMRYKRGAVIFLHLGSGISLIAFGLVLLVVGKFEGILIVFYISYAIFAIFMGMVMPVWQVLIVRIFSEEKAVSGLSWMVITQNIAKLIGSFIIIKLVGTYAFSLESSGIMFIMIGTLFSLGAFSFFFTREFLSDEELKTPVRKTNMIRHWIETIVHIKKNHNFLYFLVGDLDSAVLVAVISFYATYATAYGGVSPAAAAGVFFACLTAGSILSNLLFGTLDWLQIKNKYLASKVMSAVGLFLLIIAEGEGGFYLASLMLGAARGIRLVIYAPTVTRLSGMKDSTNYFSILPVLMLPVSSGLPLIFGKFLDGFIGLQANAYRVIFAASIGMVLVCLFFTVKTNFHPESVNDHH